VSSYQRKPLQRVFLKSSSGEQVLVDEQELGVFLELAQGLVEDNWHADFGHIFARELLHYFPDWDLLLGVSLVDQFHSIVLVVKDGRSAELGPLKIFESLFIVWPLLAR